MSVAVVVMLGLIAIVELLVREHKATRLAEQHDYEEVMQAAHDAAECARIAENARTMADEVLRDVMKTRDEYESRLKGLEIRERERAKGLRV